MTCNVQQKLISKIAKILKVCYFYGIEKFDGFFKNLKMYLLGEWPGHHFDQKMGKKITFVFQNKSPNGSRGYGSMYQRPCVISGSVSLLS